MTPASARFPRIGAAWRSRSPWLSAAMAFLPGAMIGVQMAGLLFFLNPDLPFSLLPLMRGILVYGSLWGMVTLAALLPFTWDRPDTARAVLPWAIVGVLTLSALVDWLHAAHLSYYMEPGINTRLIKAAAGLSAAAIIGFYTALLHSLHNRPYGIRSRLLMAGLVLASVWVMVERREAFKPQFEEPPRQALVEPQLRPTLVAIGIGGATLDAILPLVQEGRLPFFASMIESGAHARLVSYPPRRTASLWTSLSSGMLPFRHGVLDDRIYAVPFLAAQGHLRLAPAGHSVTHWGFLGAAARPVNASTSEVLTIWEVLERLGVSYGLIGWPLSDPAPEGALFAFSDRFFDGQYGRSSAHPKELAERGTLFRPDLAAIDPAQVLGPSIELTPAVREALRQDMWRESLTRFLLEQEPRVGALFIYLPGLEHISRAYLGAYYDVRFEGKQGSERQAAASYLVRYYEHLDRYLQSVLGRIQEPSVVAVVSAHGYEAPRGWATLPSRLMAENAWRGTSSGAPDGVLMLSGRGIERGVFLNAAQLSDVVPTVLYAMGLPIARDLDGRVLTGAFSSGYLARQPLTFIPSYETLDRAEEQQQPPEASTEVAPGG